MITELANQSSLLAMNASIEARMPESMGVDFKWLRQRYNR